MGYEHRKINQTLDPRSRPGSRRSTGFQPGASIPSTRQEVDSLFAELNFPIVTSTMNVPCVRSLDLAIAWRRDEFSSTNLLLVPESPVQTSASFANENPEEDFGGSPTVSLRYQPFSDLMFRASWRQSIRPPTFDELFTPITQTFPAFFGTGLRPPSSRPVASGLAEIRRSNQRRLIPTRSAWCGHPSLSRALP